MMLRVMKLVAITITVLACSSLAKESDWRYMQWVDGFLAPVASHNEVSSTSSCPDSPLFQNNCSLEPGMFSADTPATCCNLSNAQFTPASLSYVDSENGCAAGTVCQLQRAWNAATIDLPVGMCKVPIPANGYYTVDDLTAQQWETYCGSCSTICGIQYYRCARQIGVVCRQTGLHLGILHSITDASKQRESECVFPMRWIGTRCETSLEEQSLAAIQLLALNEFNHRSSAIIPNLPELIGSCKLNFSSSLIVDTESGDLAAIEAAYTLARSSDVIVGSQESRYLETTSVFLASFGIPVSSYAIAPVIENPQFRTTINSNQNQRDISNAICAYFLSNGYSIVTVLSRPSDEWDPLYSYLIDTCSRRGIRFLPYRLSSSVDTMIGALKTAKKTGVNVVLYTGEFDSFFKMMLSQAAQLELLKTGSLWMFTDLKVVETFSQLDSPVQILLDGSMIVQSAISGDMYDRFVTVWNSLESKSLMEGTILENMTLAKADSSYLIKHAGSYAFDNIIAMGLAMCNNVHYANHNGVHFIDSMSEFTQNYRYIFEWVSFTGLSGNVKFDSSFSRVSRPGSTAVYSVIRGEDGTFSNRPFAYFDNNSSFITEGEIRYTGGSFQKPLNREIPQEEMGYNRPVRVVTFVLAVLGILIGLSFLAWTEYHRSNPIIKASQVNFLRLTVAGAVISQCSIFFMGVTDETGSTADEYGGNAWADVACNLTVWFYALGFVLTFPALFAKLWRVDQIFNNSLQKMRELQLSGTLSDRSLVKYILWLISFDVLVLSVWSIGFPMKYVRTTLMEDYLGQKMSSVGSCQGEFDVGFLGILGLYHLLILTLGCIIAYKARFVNTGFSEAKHLFVAMFANLQVLMVGIPCLFILSTDDSAASNLFLRAGIVFLNDLMVMVVIFVPKIKAVYYGLSESGVGAHVFAQGQFSKSDGSTVFKGSKTAVSTLSGSTATHSSL